MLCFYIKVKVEVIHDVMQHFHEMASALSLLEDVDEYINKTRVITETHTFYYHIHIMQALWPVIIVSSLYKNIGEQRGTSLSHLFLSLHFDIFFKFIFGRGWVGIAFI